MSKKKICDIKLQIAAGKANPAPPIGPALGQRGLNIKMFCDEFNAATKEMEPGTPIPVVISAFADRSFSFILKLPPVSYYLKKAAKITKGSTEPGKKASVATITWENVLEIAEVKKKDMNTEDVEAAAQMVAGSARSMGIDVLENQ